MTTETPPADAANANANVQQETLANPEESEEPKSCKEKCKDCLCWDILCMTDEEDDEDWDNNASKKKKSTKKKKQEAPAFNNMDREVGNAAAPEEAGGEAAAAETTGTTSEAMVAVEVTNTEADGKETAAGGE